MPPGEQIKLPITLANTDVWLEILKYFEIALELDSLTEVQEKRRAAITISLLSPGLTGLALNTLWRSMTTLEPAVRVINAAASPSNKFITYPIESGCWVLRRALSKYQRERVKNYLSRIQDFHAKDMGSLRETTLWPALAACLAVKIGSLLPNLQSLLLSCDSTTALVSWVNVSPLLTSNIHSFSLSSSSAKIAEVFVTLLQAQDVLPVNVTYRGIPSKKVVYSLMHYAGLESLKFDFGGYSLEGAGYTTSIIQLFNRLTCLKELQVDLRFFPFTEVEDSILTVQNLRNLEITGSALDLRYLLRSVKFPNLNSLKMTISCGRVGGLWWGGPLCSYIATGAPSLQHLSFRMQADSQIEITLQDLKLFSNLDLRSLYLVNIRHGLMRFDFDQIASLWPSLHVLSISGTWEGSFVGASDAFIPLARHPNLRILELPLDFAGFGDLVSSDRSLPRSRITDIICVRSKDTPTAVVETLMLVRNLLRLFPSLRKIGENGSGEGNEKLAPLQVAITTVRELLSDYTSRYGRVASTL